MTRICIVRHGETDWNKTGQIQGKTDIALNQTGIQQARECSDYLRQYDWDVIVTSPLSRAARTAEIINEQLDIPLIKMEEFVERDFGMAEGLSKEERMSRYPDKKYPDQETRESVVHRVSHGLERILNDYPDKRVLLVAHGAVINVILSLFSNHELGTGKTRLVNAGLSELEHIDGKWQINYANESSHLSQFSEKGKM